jgi:hypothetical protein
VSGLPELELLALRKNLLSMPLPVGLVTGLPRLRFLFLSENPVVGQLPCSAFDLPSLE